MNDQITLIGETDFRNQKRKFGIKDLDRQRHIYVVGKTGTGKTTLLENMAKQDIQAGRGLAIVDPHGEFAEKMIDFVPSSRVNDVIYFNPSDIERPMGLNILEAKTPTEKDFAIQEMVAIFYQLFPPEMIGPMFEHQMRNYMATLMSDPENAGTIVEIPRIVTDDKFQKRWRSKVTDPVVRSFWEDEMDKTSDFHKSEVLDYIVSKFGRFITNKTMRNIIGQSDSAFDFRRVMDEGKILLINLSKGKLGEENSSFLGLVLIPKILIAAMSRQEIPEDKRRDFFLYVDEFQIFATPDFATILSEARKYHLNLTVANQFIGQMDDEVKNAIFGNVGTLVSFRVGVTDASYMQREYQPVFGETDLINIERFHAYMKTIVDNEPVPPFSVDMTKDIKVFKAGANEKIAQAVIQLSRLKYGRPKELVEAEINQRARL